MSRLRQGRKNAETARNLYLQHGDQASEDDTYIGVIFDPALARALIEIVNGDRPTLGDGGELRA